MQAPDHGASSSFPDMSSVYLQPTWKSISSPFPFCIFTNTPCLIVCPKPSPLFIQIMGSQESKGPLWSLSILHPPSHLLYFQPLHPYSERKKLHKSNGLLGSPNKEPKDNKFQLYMWIIFHILKIFNQCYIPFQMEEKMNGEHWGPWVTSFHAISISNRYLYHNVLISWKSWYPKECFSLFCLEYAVVCVQESSYWTILVQILMFCDAI